MTAPPDSPASAARPRLGRNVVALGLVSFFTDMSSEMIYPLLPVFLTATLGASAAFVGAIEGTAESVAALLKLASGWWSDRVHRRKPLVVVGYVIASITRPLVAVAQTASQVLAIRVADRVGKGLRSSPRDALIADSVDPAIRGRAYGFQRAWDNAGAVAGPLIAFVLLQWEGLTLRHVFWLALVPGAFAVATLLWGVREVPKRVARSGAPLDLSQPMGGRFWAFMAVIFVFTLGNSTDAFLLLRARQLGVPLALTPIIWALLNAVKSVTNTPGGALSDRIGRRPALMIGWTFYAAVYLAFAHASAQWQAWALFAVYGLYFGFAEGAERALVSDVVPPERRGTAFGWFNLAVGLGALPASLIFGLIWDRVGPDAAFTLGAALALAAAAGIALVGTARARA
ncbi:MAG: MFS transporter [Gemmatimonadota bacterium]|nr:MFS transporter [Gemmatimonadota bacterium]MDE3127211.1 MFS transporter [Gemmatimonadota bacterium]